jgi:predicted GIY-YIG superfamily endonuclease
MTVQLFRGQYTRDLREWLQVHNESGVLHTSKSGPWELETCAAFTRRERAAQFEKHLKSGSGRVFANRHFWP